MDFPWKNPWKIHGNPWKIHGNPRKIHGKYMENSRDIHVKPPDFILFICPK
jgi:hypothetical protein